MINFRLLLEAVSKPLQKFLSLEMISKTQITFENTSSKGR